MALHESAAWRDLTEMASVALDTHLRELMTDGDRCGAMVASHGDIVLDYSRQNMSPAVMDKLVELAAAAGLEEKRAAMASGEHINATEDRAVMHMALRAPRSHGAIMVDGENAVDQVNDVLDRIRAFVDKVRGGEWVGATGKPLTNVVSIGIGGSYLGPEFVFEALKCDAGCAESCAGRTLRFLANVDPVDVSRATAGLDPETTLVVVVSKSFTTAETMLNARTMRDWLVRGIPAAEPEAVKRQHIIALSTSVELATDFGIAAENVFGFWNWVGGRFSVCSAVGVMPLALHYGMDSVDRFLAGAHDMDAHFLSAPMKENLPVLLGLIGVWNATFLQNASRAVLPYSQALVRFAAHIQQVDMESNGKRVGMDGGVLPYATGPIIFGEPGTNGQHSFYQLIHQGRVIPAEFIGFCESQAPVALEGEPVSNHDELMSNFFAQPDALAAGKTLAELEDEGVPPALRPHKEFPGNRPSLSLLFQRLDAFSTGQLLALYEHRVAVEGFIWGINSFDQWGVQLGKVLAKQVRSELSAARASGAAVDAAKFNPSTAALLGKYLGK